jgi:Mrp family chromosome partitioning ATPase
MIPAESAGGIKIVSTNLVLEHETDPVLWRGPMLMGVLQQFWEEVAWGEIDYLIVDMPPGTGDVALTVFQQVPVDGIVIVTSPQDLVQMVVAKAVNMARQMDIPVLGLVENMAYALCPDCGRHIEVFGPSKVGEVADAFGLEVLASLPIDPALATAADAGSLERALPEGLIAGVVEAVLAA